MCFSSGGMEGLRLLGRVNTWLITEQIGMGRGPHEPSFDIKRNGRAFAYDMDDLEDAENRIVNDRHFDPDKDRVILLGTDGYRTPLSLRKSRRRS